MEAEEKPTPSSTGAEFGRRVAEFAAGQKAGGGRYTLIKFLGKGGMGVVWLARDEHLRDDVALKFLPADIHHDLEALEDMRRETLKSRKLSHPNIIRIHDLHVAPDESPFISMEYIAGAPLNALKVQQPQRFFAWGYLKPIVKQLCDALEYAHKQKVIHRDLKPANMMLTTDGVLKLADFGIAAVVSDSMSRVSQKHSTSGTLSYMSPEQMNGQRPKPADDIYALGATMYELLTSKAPFYSGDIVHQVQNLAPQPLAERLAELELSNEIPADVAAMVMACLSKDPAQRPASAGAVAEWIGLQSGPSMAQSAFAQPEPEPGAVAAPEVSKPKISSRTRARLELAGAIAAGFTVLAVVVGTLMPRNAKEGQDPTKKSKSSSPTATASSPPEQGAQRSSQAPPLPPSSAATKDAPFVNSLGMKFVPVPITGGPTGGQRVLFSIWETRVQDYEVFAKETKREWPKTDYEQKPTEPAVNVSWEDGTAFCAWLTERERKAGKLGTNEKYRLSSDHEWSCAVGIGGQEDATKLPVSKSEKITDQFPWGTVWPPPRGVGNYGGEDGHPKTAPAGSFTANPFGIYDLGGNVWEVCDDQFDGSPNGRPLRGGTWTLWGDRDRKFMLSSYRFPADSRLRFRLNGFRCVIAPTAPATAAAPASAEGWQNLLSRVDVKRDSLMAPWTMANGVLRSPQRNGAGAGSLGMHQTLAFPVADPPRNYDFRLRLTRDKPGFAVAVTFVRDGSAGDLWMDGGQGFRLVPPLVPNNFSVKSWLPVGELHELLIEVREDRVRISHDGKEQIVVAGKIPSGQFDPAFFPPEKKKPPYFGIGVCEGDLTVHAAEFRETDRDGKLLAPESSSAAKKKRRRQ